MISSLVRILDVYLQDYTLMEHLFLSEINHVFLHLVCDIKVVETHKSIKNAVRDVRVSKNILAETSIVHYRIKKENKIKTNLKLFK